MNDEWPFAFGFLAVLCFVLAYWLGYGLLVAGFLAVVAMFATLHMEDPR